ncbi:hypothetical protein ABZW03_08380 [Kitasatospora sp. NPDC004799]|uniref:hypothetical protein n=1 Tax=Kitasatospora sp. NPDC004799 TaxID=3154460 RepID=UPI0033B611E0
MTMDQVIDRCRSEWMFSDVTEEEVEDMVAELRDHLQDAVLVGRTPQSVVGGDVTAFAADWAAARRTHVRHGAGRRLAGHAYAGSVALLVAGHLIGWTGRVEIVPASLAAVALFASVMTFTPYWRALLHWPLWRWTALSFAGSAVLLALYLVGGRPVLLGVPLWGTFAFLLPGLGLAALSAARRNRVSGSARP